MQVDAQQSAIAHLFGVSADNRAQDVARLALRHLQDAVVNLVYRRHPPGRSRLLNLGCGDCLYPGWINADRFRTGYWLTQLGGLVSRRLRLPDWVLDAAEPWRCADDHWDGIYTEHMLEHLSYREAVAVMREMLRTLRPGAWARIILPDLGRFIDFYNGDRGDSDFLNRFAFGAEAISFLTQNFGHISAWDGALLEAVLREIGFVNVRIVAYGEGADRRLLKDSPDRRWESVYVEAQKPPRGSDLGATEPALAACVG
ncbi:MAG: class I SAM-dependent methyltransferase [Stellaceae bacterium]